MKIIKIKPEKPIKQSVKSGDNYKIELAKNMSQKGTAKRKFSIKKLK